MSDDSKTIQHKPMSARRRARAAAVQGLYQMMVDERALDDIYQHCLEHHAHERCDRDYFKVLLYGTVEQISLLDELMLTALDRDIQSLTPVELSLLRLAMYELKFRIDVPAPVVINEALELAKIFGTEEGYRYINAVLDALLSELRPVSPRS